MVLERDEANRLVQAARGIVLGDAETHGWVSLRNAGLDEVTEEPSSDPFVPTGRDHCDRELGDIVSYEAEAMARLGEGPKPSRTHGCFLFGNESVVTSPWPSKSFWIFSVGECFLGAV